MAAIEASAFTTPTVEGITRQEIIKRFLRRTGFGEYGTLSTGASTTSFADTDLIGRGFNAKSFVGGFCRIVNSGGGAPEGEVRPVATFTPATGAFTTAAFSTNVGATDEYELWRTLHPQLVLDWLDECLTEDIYYPCWTMLTEVPDGDMEQSHTTDWQASTVTLTKPTTTPAMYGKRFLHVVANSTEDYVRSRIMYVQPGKSYHVSALVRCSEESFTLSPATLIIIDEINGGSIAEVTTDLMFMHRIYADFNTPAGCTAISIRLQTDIDEGVTHWDEVCLYPLGAREIRLPWWIKTKNQLLKVFRLQPEEIATASWAPGLIGTPDNRWEVQDQYYGDGGLQLVGRGTSLSMPLYICGLRNETAYANDYTEVKLITAETILAGLLYKAFLYMGTNYISNQADMAKYMSLAGIWEQRYKKAKYSEMERMQQIMTAPGKRVYHLDPRMQYSV